ncbi:hypothetical protein KBZ21_41750, partial [Streptomyces sp. A73]|nr:hypothetical protein [Streptomyces sp. A73]
MRCLLAARRPLIRAAAAPVDEVGVVEPHVGPLEPGDAWFIARHSPARVLAEVDAKRGLLDRYAEVADMDY